MPPDEYRSEGTLSLSEVPYAGAKPFAYFLASEKVSRCKSETISRRYRRNGYTHRPTLTHEATDFDLPKHPNRMVKNEVVCRSIVGVNPLAKHLILFLICF